jgi:hypothetical protein
MNVKTTSPTIAAPHPIAMPRLRTVVFWAASAPILLETAVGAEWDLARISFVRDVFAHLGYPLYLLTILGVAKILAVIALVAPRAQRVKEWAYAGIFFVYAGAACSHYAVGDGVDKMGMPVLFAALTLVSSALWAASRQQKSFAAACD